MSRERAETVMRTYLTEVVGQQRYELIPEFAAPDMIDHTQEIRGPDALLAHAKGFCDNIPGVQVEVERIFANDDTAVGIWRWHGTPTNVYGRNSTGDPVLPRYCASIFRFEDNMLVDYQVFVDAVDILGQVAERP